MAFSYHSTVASPVKSIGFFGMAYSGRNALSALTVWEDSSGSSRPAFMASSAARMPNPPPSVMMAILGERRAG